MWLLIVAVLCLGASPGRAQLGYTRAQWEARCGEPTEQGKSEGRIGDWRASYHQKGWNFVVTFWHGHTGRYGIEHVDGASLSATETDIFLAANTGEASWSNPISKTDKRGNPVTIWWRSDGAAAFSMVYSTGIKTLVFQTKEFCEALNAARDAATQEK